MTKGEAAFRGLGYAFVSAPTAGFVLGMLEPADRYAAAGICALLSVTLYSWLPLAIGPAAGLALAQMMRGSKATNIFLAGGIIGVGSGFAAALLFVGFGDLWPHVTGSVTSTDWALFWPSLGSRVLRTGAIFAMAVCPWCVLAARRFKTAA